MTDDLPDWDGYLAAFGRAAGNLALLADPADPAARQEGYRLLFQTLAAGYLTAFANPDQPDFVPLVNNVLNVVGTNPDFIYAYTRVDGTGSYRLSGYRGGGLFLLFDFSAGGLGVMDELAPSVGMLDIDTIGIGDDGSFDVLLSAERPAGHTGDWVHLDPRTRTINLRQAAYDWGGTEAARIAIERLDRPIGVSRLGAGTTAERLQRLAAYPERFSRFALNYCKGQRDRGLVNKLEPDDWAGRGGLAGQHYYQGIFQLRPGEAIILETELPERVRYWNVQLNDPMWNSIDWFNCQSSLNAGQAALDADGRFRAVIAVDDPGVPNWLDPGGHATGSIMLRWMEASSGPAPTLSLVPLAEIRQHLPAATPMVSPEARQETLRLRRRGAQLRRRW